MNTKESQLWRMLRKGWSRYGFFTRIENLAGDGIPDVAGTVAGVDRFIELKVIDHLKITLRDSQVEWLRTHAEHQGLAWVLVRRHNIIRIWAGSKAVWLVQPGAWNKVPCDLEFSPIYDYRAMLKSMF